MLVENNIIINLEIIKMKNNKNKQNFSKNKIKKIENQRLTKKKIISCSNILVRSPRLKSQVHKIRSKKEK